MAAAPSNRNRALRRPFGSRPTPQGLGMLSRAGSHPPHPDQLRRTAIRRGPLGRKRQARPFRFVTKMRDRGVEVVEMHKLLAETLENPEAKKWLLDNQIVANEVGIGLVAETTGLLEASIEKPCRILIGGLSPGTCPTA